MDKDDLKNLLNRIELAFNQSDIKAYCEANNLKWFYDLCATPIIPGAPLIVGFNWGAAKGMEYKLLSPQERFIDLHNKKYLGSMSRIVPYLTQYFSEEILEIIGQTNFCFFRSAKGYQISKKDLDLCKSIFFEFLEKAVPSNILCFSGRLKDYLFSSGLLNNLRKKEITFRKGNREVAYTAVKATLNITGCKIAFLPHPNYPISSIARRQAWEFCFKIG